MILFFALFFALIVFCAVMAYKYRNPYKLCLVFGKKGSGKTTLLVKKAIQYMRKGKTVYSTVYIPGAHLFDVKLLGVYTFPPESVVFIDEVGMIWDNRNFKAFREDVRDWFKLQRHYHVTVWLFSQTNDIDKKLRDLMDEMYLCNCHMGFISVARKIKRLITIVHPSAEGEARIADDIDFVPVWYSLFGAKSAIFTYIPNWVKFYDSFEAPALPFVDAVYQEIPEAVRHCYNQGAFKRFFLSMALSARRAVALAGAQGGKKHTHSRKFVSLRNSVHKFTKWKK
ncbi:MAG: ATPase family protein [Inoviridae sp.]|nr:MAG: ATPase family protein [Inoviridae sp.]